MKTYFEPHEYHQSGVTVFDKMDLLFVEKLNLARSYSSIPWTLTSSWRDPVHNKKEGGRDNSSHLDGLAVDISATSGTAKWIIVMALLKAGFTRIGIGKDFVHADMDESKPQNVIWTY